MLDAQIPMKETPEDVRTKVRLWESTEREVRAIAARYAAAKLPQVPYSDRQIEIVDAAAIKGYPRNVIRGIGGAIHRDREVEVRDRLKAFRQRIGL